MLMGSGTSGDDKLQCSRAVLKFVYFFLEKLLNCMLRFRIMLFMQQKIKIDFTF